MTDEMTNPLTEDGPIQTQKQILALLEDAGEIFLDANGVLTDQGEVLIGTGLALLIAAADRQAGAAGYLPLTDAWQVSQGGLLAEFSAVGLLLFGHNYSRTKQAVAQPVP